MKAHGFSFQEVSFAPQVTEFEITLRFVLRLFVFKALLGGF